MCKRLNFISIVFLILFFISFYSCRKISESYKDSQNAVVYQSAVLKDNPTPTADIKLMSWNIRFGIARNDWFGDACGKNTIFESQEIQKNLNNIISKINLEDPDLLMLQECDVNSKRSAYTDELTYILEKTKFNYAYYAPVWQSQFIPSHGLGKMDMGIVIFSKWPLQNVKRLNFPLRSDQGTAEKYFYLQYCLLRGELQIEGFKKVVIFNLHSVAFASDNTKEKQSAALQAKLDEVINQGGYFACGGDFNSLPITATKKDYCIEDICEGEKFHNTSSNPQHKEGSNYEGEQNWFSAMFTKYIPSLPLSKYQNNEVKYFTHTTRHPDHAPDRRLDHFFTNYEWVPGTDTTYQDGIKYSDHAPISVKFKLPK